MQNRKNWGSFWLYHEIDLAWKGKRALWRSSPRCGDESNYNASVFVSAARPSEKLYPLSDSFLQKVKGTKIFCPTLVLAECAAAIARPTGDSAHYRRLVSLIQHFPGIRSCHEP